MRPRLALVPGEPAGVGPELCTRAMHRPHAADIVVFGDRDAPSQAADRIGLPVSFADADAAAVPAGTIRIIDLPNAAPATHESGRAPVSTPVPNPPPVYRHLRSQNRLPNHKPT